MCRPHVAFILSILCKDLIYVYIYMCMYILQVSFQILLERNQVNHTEISCLKAGTYQQAVDRRELSLLGYVNVGFVVDNVACGRLFSGYCGVPLSVLTPPILRFVYHFPCDTKKARPVRNLSLGRTLPEFPTRHSTLMKSKQRSSLFDWPFFEARIKLNK
jgi:hypothetical protein